jgi:hypothetical protein
MTIASATSRVSYVGDGVTTAFAVPFYWQANADIKVYLQSSTGVQTLQVLGTNYNLTGVGVSSGGTCTFTTAPTSTTGAIISIYRDPPVTQTTSYNNNDPFPAKSHENALDKLTTLEQRARDLQGRTVQLPDSDPILDMHMPTVANRKNKLLGFDTSGLPTAVVGPSFVGGTDIGAAVVSTRNVAAVTTFAGSVLFIITGGIAVVGDGGGATYKRGTGTGQFTDGGGVTWVPASLGAVSVSTKAVAQTMTFDASILSIQTNGTTVVGDGGATSYKRGTGTGQFTDAGGTTWVPILTSASTFGAIGDGTTDNLTAINAAITAAGWRGIVELPIDVAGGVYHCSAEPSNPKGVYFHGAGYIQTPETTTGRKRRWDLRGEQYPQVEGEEYLGIFHEILRSGAVSSTKVEFLGDSTSLGAGVADANYVVSTLIQNNFLLHGFNCIFTNRAISGTTTEDLRTAQVPLVNASLPHLVIVRSGINDPYLRGSSPGTIHTQAQVDEVAELARVSLDAALASMRASVGNATRLSIILMTPSVATLSIDGRDERYLETIGPMYRELARKYQCTFIDTYRIWRNARGLNATFAVGRAWLDTIYTTPDGGIHPNEAFDMQIADRITNVVLPATLRRTLRAANLLPQLNTQLTLINGWTTYTGSPQQNWARRREQLVQLEGMIVPGTTTAGTVITTLPTNMRPSRRRFFGVGASVAGTVLFVETDGTVGVSVVTGSPTWVTLENICFIVDN